MWVIGNQLETKCVLTILHFLTVDLLVDGVVAGVAREFLSEQLSTAKYRTINHLGCGNQLETKYYTIFRCVLTFLHFLTVDLLVDGVVAGATRGTSRAVEDNQNV
eukprot:snap_masked-scaffold_157-processed-gene-0.0-mRNA-1 protein AED:1.00 eAED:1.00 QI:0/0/0/0/1/1/2/0/104